MGKRYGFGIIGAGVISHDHAAGVVSLGDRARLIAAADPNRQALRDLSLKQPVPLVCDDYRSMLERPDIDVVTIATPPSTHEQIVIDALAAGKAVACEKPIAHTLASAERMIEAAGRYPGKLCVLHQLRDDPEVAKLRHALAGGRLGAPRSARFHRRTNFDRQHASAGWWGRWSVAGGGMVITQCIHELDLMITLLGDPVRVTATMDTERQPIESEDTFNATVTLDSGVELECSGTLNASEFATEFAVNCERGELVRPFAVESDDAQAAAAVRADIEAAFPTPRPVSRSLPARIVRKAKALAGLHRSSANRPAQSGNLHGALFGRFIDSIEAGDEAPVTPTDGRRSLELCVAIYTAAITGEPVELPLGTDARFYQGITADDYRNRRSLAGA